MDQYRVLGEIINDHKDLIGFRMVDLEHPQTVRRVLLSQLPPRPVTINAKELFARVWTEGVPPAPDVMGEAVRLQRERGLRR